MGEFIALVFIIWFIWYLIKVGSQGNSSHSSKVDYRNHGSYGTRKRESKNTKTIPEGKKEHRDLVSYYTSKDQTNAPADYNYFLQSAIDKHLSGDSKGSLEDLNKTIELNPNCDEAYYLRSFRRGILDHKGKLDDLRKVLEINPNHPEIESICRSISERLMLLKSYKESILYSTKTLEINPENLDNISCYSSRGRCYIELGKFNEAIMDLNLYIERMNDPEKVKKISFSEKLIGIAYKNRAIAKKGLSNLKDACEDWKKAADLGNEEAAELLKEHCE